MGKTKQDKIKSEAEISADAIKKAVGQKIQEVRRKQGYTASYVARKLGVNRVTLTHIENGRNHINAVTLWELACLFGCEIGDFFPDTTDKFKLSKVDISHISRIDPNAVGWVEKVAAGIFNHVGRK